MVSSLEPWLTRMTGGRSLNFNLPTWRLAFAVAKPIKRSGSIWNQPFGFSVNTSSCPSGQVGGSDLDPQEVVLYEGAGLGAGDSPNTRAFCRVSCRPSTKKGGIYHGKPGFPRNTLKKAGILSMMSTIHEKQGAVFTGGYGGEFDTRPLLLTSCSKVRCADNAQAPFEEPHLRRTAGIGTAGRFALQQDAFAWA